jgi:hypothetical protein
MDITNKGEHGQNDKVIRLRLWGTDVTYALSESATREFYIGASNNCTLQLTDQDIAPMHAKLIREREQWRIRALKSTNELRRDGERCSEFFLTPGVEVGIGGTTLIGESRRSIALREFCARLLGWGGDRLGAVDRALRAIRFAAAWRSTLILQGEEDLVPLAYALHRRVLGPAAPFVICDPRRGDLPATVRSPANRGSGVAAFEAAAGGSLCLRGRRLSQHLGELLKLIDEPDTRVQLIVCMSNDGRGEFLVRFPINPMPIEVPPLAIREAELPRLVQAYAKDAIAELSAQPSCFSDDDCEWVMKHGATSLSEIEKATLRIVAVNMSGNVQHAAKRLRMAPVSLSRWIHRRATLPYFAMERNP